MIADKDRSNFIGASDVDKVVGKWTSDTFAKWWLEKLGMRRNNLKNKFVDAGNGYERRILESLGIPMEFDKQIILEDLLLRVNLDGNTNDCIYECKTFKAEKGFKLPPRYINQVQVQMFASGIHQAEVVAYGLEEEDYNNFFRQIDPNRLQRFHINYDPAWINTKYLPKLKVLVDCLKRGVLPNEAAV